MPNEQDPKNPWLKKVVTEKVAKPDSAVVENPWLKKVASDSPKGPGVKPEVLNPELQIEVPDFTIPFDPALNVPVASTTRVAKPVDMQLTNLEWWDENDRREEAAQQKARDFIITETDDPMDAYLQSDKHWTKMRRKLGRQDDDQFINDANFKFVETEIEDKIAIDQMGKLFSTTLDEIAYGIDPENKAAVRMAETLQNKWYERATEEDLKHTQIQQKINKIKLEEDTSDPEVILKLKDLAGQKSALKGDSFVDPITGERVTKGEDIKDYQKEYTDQVENYTQEYEQLAQTDIESLGETYYKVGALLEFLEGEMDARVRPYYDKAVGAMVEPGAPLVGPLVGAGMLQFMPDELKAVQQRYISARARFDAAGKAFLANRSPEAIDKDVGFIMQTGLDKFAEGVLTKSLYEVVKANTNPTDRQLLDGYDQVAAAAGIKLTPSEEEHIELSTTEKAVGQGSHLAGLMLKLVAAGRIEQVLWKAPMFGAKGIGMGIKGSKNLTAPFKYYARSLDDIAGVLNKGTGLHKAAGVGMKLASEELKTLTVGMPLGTGIGMGGATHILNKIPIGAIKSDFLRGFTKLTGGGLMVATSMEAGHVTQLLMADVAGGDQFSTALKENYANMEFDDVMISAGIGIVLGAPRVRGMSSYRYAAEAKLSSELKKAGYKEDARYVDEVIGLNKKVDAKIKELESQIKKGKTTPEEAERKLDTESIKLKAQFEAKQRIRDEEAGNLEKITPSKADLANLGKTAVADAEGNPIIVYHGSPYKFSVFSKAAARKNRQSIGVSRNEYHHFTTNSEFAKSWGDNIHERYLAIPENKVKRIKNIKELTKKNAKQWQAEGYEGVMGFERWTKPDGTVDYADVFVPFSNEAIIKPTGTKDIWRNPTADNLQKLADRIRETKQIPSEGGVGAARKRPPFPYAPEIWNAGVEGAARSLEGAATVVQAIADGIAAAKEHPLYKSIDPELRVKVDKELDARMKQHVEDAMVEIQKKNMEVDSKELQEHAETEIKPWSDKLLQNVADRIGGELSGRVKTPERVSKKKLEGKTVEDNLQYTIQLKSVKDIPDAVKTLREEGFKLTIDKGQTGFKAVRQEGDVSIEVQLHTSRTAAARDKMYEATNIVRNYDPEAQLEAHGKDTGSTFSLSGENLKGVKKSTVSIFPERTEIVEGEITKDILEEYIEKNNDLLAGNEYILSVGTWAEVATGKTYLDIVATLPHAEAIKMGLKYNQKAIYNLETGETQNIGGTGEVVDIKKNLVTTTSYQAGSLGAGDSNSNILVRPGAPSKSNAGRVLMAQIHPRVSAAGDMASPYFERLYSVREGYWKSPDFWEVPEWVPMVSNTFKNADFIAIRDPIEAAKHIKDAGYPTVMFSVMDVNKTHVKEIARRLQEISPKTKIMVGGYVKPEFFKDSPNVKFFNNIEEMAKTMGVKYVEGRDNRHFKGTKTIPRLCMSEGCLHKCAFCVVPKDVKPKSKEHIDQQIAGFKNLDYELVYLDDKTFGQAENVAYLVDAYTAIKKNNPKFKGFIVQTTAPAFLKLDPEIIKNSGIKYVELGVESYNNDILKRVKKPHTTELIDQAIEKIREMELQFVPNIIVGLAGKTSDGKIWSENAKTYKNTLDALKKNEDIISHVNVYNLATYEGTVLGEQLGDARVEADVNENAVQRSYLKDKKVHEKFYKDVLAFGERMLEKGPKQEKLAPEARATEFTDIEEKALPKEQERIAGLREGLFGEEIAAAWRGIENVEISPEKAKAPTVTQKKIAKATGISKEQKKIVMNEYTALKEQIKQEARSSKDLKAREQVIRDSLVEFVKSKKGLAGIDAKLTQPLLRRLVDMDLSKPGSVDAAIAYIDKVINDQVFRNELIALDRVDTDLRSITDPKTYEKKESGVLKGKDKFFIETKDKLAEHGRRMNEDSWEGAQKQIEDMLNSIPEGQYPTVEQFEQIERLSFSGLLNETFGGNLAEKQNRLQDLKDIRKQGRTEAFALRLFARDMENQVIDGSVKTVLGGADPPVMAPDARQALNIANVDKYRRFVEWVSTDTWFTLMDRMSRNDKISDPFKSYLSKTMGGAVIGAERLEYRGLQTHYDEITNSFRKIFELAEGKKGNRQQMKLRNKYSSERGVLEYMDISGNKQSVEVTQNEAYKRWMELQDPTLARSNEAAGYLRNGLPTEKAKALEAFLDPKVKAWAEWQLNEFYPKYWATINPIYRRIFGTDMPFNSNYSPIFVDSKIDFKDPKQAADLLTNVTVRSTANNASLKARVNHGKELAWMDGDKVLINHIAKMEFFKAWAEPLRLMNGVFKNPEMRAAVQQNLGRNYLPYVDAFVDDFFPRKYKFTTPLERMATKLRTNYTIGSLALKPTIFLKQLTSIPAYMENVPLSEFLRPDRMAANFGLFFKEKGWKVLGEGVLMQERYMRGWDRDVIDAMHKDYNTMMKGGAKFKDWAMFLTKWGDKGAIIAGGWPVYKHHYNKAIKEGRSIEEAKRTAMDEFEFATRNSQQAGRTADLSFVQQANPYVKLMTMYKTAPFQYHRKVAGAIRNMAAGRGDLTKHAKTLVIYHVLLPQIFQIVSNGFKWDKQDQLQAAVLGNFNNIFAFGDAITNIIDVMQGDPFEYRASPVTTIVTDVKKILNDMEKIDITDITAYDVWEALDNMSRLVGNLTGTPADAFYNTIDAFLDIANNETNYPWRRALGYSEWTLEHADYELPEAIMNFWKDNPNATIEEFQAKDLEIKELGVQDLKKKQ